MAFLQPHTANLTPHPTPVVPLADLSGREWVETNGDRLEYEPCVFLNTVTLSDEDYSLTSDS